MVCSDGEVVVLDGYGEDVDLYMVYIVNRDDES